jgi:hypothetical protein
MTRTALEAARAKYRRSYDRLYIAAMKANTAEESARIYAALARANKELDAAEARS